MINCIFYCKYFVKFCFCLPESKSWKCNLQSKDIIDKYLKPLPSMSSMLAEDAKKLAHLFNQRKERQVAQEQQSDGCTSTEMAVSKSQDLTQARNEVSFNLVNEDFTDLNTAVGRGQVRNKDGDIIVIQLALMLRLAH